MGEYKKPLVTIDAGLAEGVYAASGAGNAVKLSDLTVSANWGSSGQLKFSADLSGVDNLSQLTLVVVFSHDLVSAWGGGASASREGNTAKFTWYSAPTSADDFYIQVNTNPSEVSISNYYYYNA